MPLIAFSQGSKDTIIFLDQSEEYKESIFEFAPDPSDRLVEERLAKIDCEIPLHFNSKVRSFIDFFTIRQRDYTKRVLTRKDKYFPLFEKILDQYNVPTDLKYLAIVESGLNPTAISPAGAVGMWQFMSYTGKNYGLPNDYYSDSRRDVEKATHAAAKYLKTLYRMFGDWELALAAYNCGPGNVRKAIRRSGYKKTFWEIYNYLPRETRSYVPQFVAVAYFINYSSEHFLFPAYKEFQYDIDTIQVNPSIDLAKFANQVNLCKEDICKLNPELRRGVIPPGKKYILKVPSDLKTKIAANLQSIMDSAIVSNPSNLNSPIVNKQYYKVKTGDAISLIAEKFGVRSYQIREWNNMTSNSLRAGQNLIIYSNKKVNSPVYAQVKSLKEYKVQPGDTLWNISQKFNGLTVEKIKSLNNLSSNEIKVGMKLKLI